MVTWRALLLTLLLAGLLPLPVLAQPPEIDERNHYLFQAGYNNTARSFAGLGQFSLHANSTREFYGLVQLGLWNTARDFLGLGQLGVQNHVRNFGGAAQVGVHNVQERFFAGLAQLGAYNQAFREFYAGAQLGVVNQAGGFIGGLQIGAVNQLLEGPDNLGPSQLGLLNIIDQASFSALGQIGVVNVLRRGAWISFEVGALNLSRDLSGVAQVGLVNLSEDTALLMQVGVFNFEEQRIRYAQLGVLNMAREIVGVQVGLVNHAGRLRGLQLGLVNISGRGGLPFCPIANFSL